MPSHGSKRLFLGMRSVFTGRFHRQTNSFSTTPLVLKVAFLPVYKIPRKGWALSLNASSSWSTYLMDVRYRHYTSSIFLVEPSYNQNVVSSVFFFFFLLFLRLLRGSHIRAFLESNLFVGQKLKQGQNSLDVSGLLQPYPAIAFFHLRNSFGFRHTYILRINILKSLSHLFI